MPTIKSLPMIEKNERPDICGPCGGACCKSMPGAYHPMQFGPQLEGVEKLLRGGKAAIDWWEGHKPLYYLRPATRRSKKIFDPSWGGECINLTGNGCALHWDKRPLACQALAPETNEEKRSKVGCVMSDKFNKLAMAQAWKPYAAQLEAIGRKVVES